MRDVVTGDPSGNSLDPPTYPEIVDSLGSYVQCRMMGNDGGRIAVAIVVSRSHVVSPGTTAADPPPVVVVVVVLPLGG
jgi:hypothetical protein